MSFWSDVISKKVRNYVLKTTLFLVCIYVLTTTVYAAPSSENVDKNNWFQSGNLGIKVYQIKNNQKIVYTDSILHINRDTIPSWNDAKTKSFSWDVSLSSHDTIFSLLNKQSSTRKTIDFVDSTYAHEAHSSWAGYNGFIIDVNMIMPKGYKYKIDSYKVNTLNKKDDGTLGGALGLYQPVVSYESCPKTDEIRNNKIVIHASQLGLMTLQKNRYSGNFIEYTLEPNETEVNFHANGGTGNMSKQTVIFDKKDCLKKNTFSRVGFSFNGWNKKIDGSGKKYSEQYGVEHEFPSEKTIDLYAQWEEIRVNDIKIREASITGYVGKSKRLIVDVEPENSYDKSLKYSSTSNNVVSITADGEMHFKRAGKATIVVTSANGIKKTAEVIVKTKKKGYPVESSDRQKNLELSIHSLSFNNAKIKAETPYNKSPYRVFIKKAGGKYKKIKRGKAVSIIGLKKLAENKKYTVIVEVYTGEKWVGSKLAFITGTVQKLSTDITKKGA